MIQIENQFLYDMQLVLTGEYSKYFTITPRVVRSSHINMTLTANSLSLKEPLDPNANALGAN
jgi:hypothetical protein